MILFIDSERERSRIAALASDDSNTVCKTTGRVYQSVEEAVVDWKCHRFYRVSYLIM